MSLKLMISVIVVFFFFFFPNCVDKAVLSKKDMK